MKDQPTGQVRAKPIPDTTAPRLGKFIDDNAEADATHYADENRAYHNLPHHHTVCHGSNEYGNAEVHITEWSRFGRW